MVASAARGWTPNGKDVDVCAEAVGDLNGKTVPRRVAGVDRVHQTGGARVDQIEDGVSEIVTKGGAAALVVHDLQPAGAPIDLCPHGLDEVAAVVAVEPGGANDEIRFHASSVLLAAQLGTAIGTHGPDRVLLRVGTIAIAGEDIVGGDLDEPGADPVAGRCQVAHRGAVDRQRQPLVGFAVVDRGEGGAVDDR